MRSRLRRTRRQSIHRVRVLTEFAWLKVASNQLNSGIGILAQHTLPPLSTRTTKLLTQRAVVTHEPIQKGKLQYMWYSAHSTLFNVIFGLVEKKFPIIIITANHGEAAQLKEFLSQHITRTIHHITATHAPHRRIVWNDWLTVNEDAPIIIGTHLAAWLPRRAHTTVIVVEPTNAQHEQWNGAAHNNRRIAELRRIFLGDDIVLLSHTPATLDLDRVMSIPTLHTWPTIVDRTIEEPQHRQHTLSPFFEDALTSRKKILIFVTHLREATHYICKDCGTLYTADDIRESSQCKKCNGMRFSKIGCGAQSIIDELFSVHIISNKEVVALLDAQTYDAQKNEARPVGITIATAPLYDRLPLADFDLIVDVSIDFEFLHPEFSSEEHLLQRLRAISVRLPAQWKGLWYVQTRKPNLLAWRAKDFSGFSSWWSAEKPLRMRFKQPPFDTIDS